MKYTWKDVFGLREEIFGLGTITILLFHLNIYVPSPQPFAFFLAKGKKRGRGLFLSVLFRAFCRVEYGVPDLLPDLLHES